MKTLRLVLGDQLNKRHSWFGEVDNDVQYVMMEMRQETDYVSHHIQKMVGFFTAMRAFASELKQEGHQFAYLTLDDPTNKQTLHENLDFLLQKFKADRFEYQLPDEYRLDEQLTQYCQSLSLDWKAFDTEHFYTTRSELSQFFEGKVTFLMESFYRHMRKKHQVLMEHGEPISGQWNYDKDNRKMLPNHIDIPPRNTRTRDVSAMVNLILDEGVQSIGSIDAKNFSWPTTRREALADLNIFCSRYLQHFGRYQDAMTSRTAFSFHSLLSFALNVKLVSPTEVIETVTDYWHEHQNDVSLSSVEGFVRQIIGWREFMRGIYWAKMPNYASLNHLEHSGKLPKWYWDGNTRMNCMHHAIGQSLEHAYAHHIQRLMLTGNFALLAMVHPDEIDQWYLGIYIDAIEWVEITNTRGMSQFADGGIVGTKPYVSSSNYINKMSDYCSSCHYSYTKKTGANACPFNSLYWNFYDQHRARLASNPRIGMVYKTLDRMDVEKKEAILNQAQYYLENIDNL